MKVLIAALAAGLLSISAAHAADPSPAQKAQQERMTQCNADAKGKSGDERKAFMKDCLSAKPAAATPQQMKMTTCNKEAEGKKGDERKAFMKTCLSAKPA